jgi:hypothetical protein
MKKAKQPGDNFSLKTKKTEDPLVIQWINTQTNLMDSLRYLMEKEIYANGVRNLQAHIPTERNVIRNGTHVSQEVEHETASALTVETPEPAESQLPMEDEFDDEDIEAWT